MIRIGNSSYSPDLAPASAKGSPAATNGDRAGAPASDQVHLSDAAATNLQERSDQIAALKAVVASPDYSPSALPVSRKLISEALSRGN